MPAHPLVGQLSALHHFRVYVDVGVVVVVLALTNLVAHFTTPWANVGDRARRRGRAGGPGALPRARLVRTRPGPRAVALGRRLRRGRRRDRADGHRDRRAAALDAPDVHEQPLRDAVGRADRLDGHHPVADRHPGGTGLPRRTARCARPRLGCPRRGRRRFTVVRPLAHRQLVRTHQRQCRVLPHARWRCVRHGGRCRRRRDRHRPPPDSCSPGCAGAVAV